MGTNGRLRTMRGAYPRKISLKSGIQKKTNKIRIRKEKSKDYATEKLITTLGIKMDLQLSLCRSP